MRLSEIDEHVQSGRYSVIASNDHYEISENEVHAAVVTAISCKGAGAFDAARKILEHVTENYPSSFLAHYELSVVYRICKRLDLAVRSAEKACLGEPTSFRYGLQHAHMLFANCAWDEGFRQLDAIAPGDEGERLQYLTIRDFGHYLREMPRQRALYITRKLRDRYYWHSAREVADQIDRAITEKRPFSLIRLGDGEGAHFQVSAADQATYPSLYESAERYWMNYLLGEGVDPVFTGFTGLASKLADYVTEADLLGVSYPSWIEHEYDISSPITIACLLKINRYLYEKDHIHGLNLCDQLVHMQLHEERLLEPIIRKLDAVTVISCLEGLPARITEKFGVQDVELIKIPSESYAPHLSGEGLIKVSEHFPDAFWPTMKRLARPHDGRVFLIAAGTYGKFYATIIKRHGGIALDLGSLVDGWMKMVTRPGYEKFVDEE